MIRRKLKKKDMMKFYRCDKNIVYSSKEEFVKFLEMLEREFYNHKFCSDKRYACVGRHRFLIDEMEELYYSKEYLINIFHNMYVCPTIWCLDNLLELIVYPTMWNSWNDHEELQDFNNDLYKGKSLQECKKFYSEYQKDGIICLEERDYILHALNMIKDSLKKCSEKLEWS